MKRIIGLTLGLLLVCSIAYAGGSTMIVDGDGEGVNVTDNSLKTMHHEESHIYEGVGYMISTHDLALGDDQTLAISLTTSSAQVHCTIMPSFGGDAVLCMFEGVDVGTDNAGNSYTLVNRNRNTSAQVATSILADTGASPNLTLNGYTNLLYCEALCGGTGMAAIGGGLGGTDFLLAANTSYCWTIENESGGADMFGLQLLLYEEE